MTLAALGILLGSSSRAAEPARVAEAMAVGRLTPSPRPAQGARLDSVEPAELSECLLAQPGAESTEARVCLQCHEGRRAKSHVQTSHPVDLVYADVQRQKGAELRPEAEVVARGGFLPGGMLRCTTCHSARSPWAARINLPPNAKVRPAVNPFRPATYEDGAATNDVPLPGSEVSPKPLCLVCHAFD